jgi:Short C-terminal domain/Bacterial PH domain
MAEATALVPHSGDPRLQDALVKIKQLLVPDEQIIASAVQRRFFALLRRREIAVATTGRFILYQRNVLPGARVSDVRWQDLRDAHIQEGIFGSTLTIRSNYTYVVTGLRKNEAQALYRQCQQQEQAWREKNRLRSLEEARARSGGIQLGAGLAAAASGPVPDGVKDSTARLKQAKTMFDQGLISDAEYEALKAKILADI